ncbi:DNA-binding protein [Frateuria sp. GZRR35]|uniref:DNA-binding protein n=1 Tax=Frateuria sp. GZRR35 TaxID=3351536 RepID=UPI003EDBEE36
MQNLLAIRRLQTFTPDAIDVRKLLAAARRDLADAGVEAVSPDNRSDAAYKCIMQCAILGLWANGYRTPTSQPGHHQTSIQCLTLTMAAPRQTVIVLDALRKRRNINDYEGDPVTEATLASCMDESTNLLQHTEAWLREHRPQLLGDL